MGASFDSLSSSAPVADRVPSEPTVSVVLATYNRLDLLKRLLESLSRQSLPFHRFEVIVVDDGSAVPARDHVEANKYPFALRMFAQANAGPAAARHLGATHAKGEILVLVDDDMDLPPHFLETHLSYHASGRPTAVFGRYADDPAIASKSLFERYHARKWDDLSRGIAEGRIRVDGTLLATGNVSMRLADYFRAGGFDRSLLRAEDMALGLDLEEIGVNLVFSDSAYSVHLSDHTAPKKWRARAFLHGQLEPDIATKHPTMPHADPWRFAFTLPMAGRVLCLGALVAPTLSHRVADLVFAGARVADAVGLEGPALRAAGLVFGMEYFRGIRVRAGSLREVTAGCVRFLQKAAASETPVPGVPPWLARLATEGVRPAQR